MYAVLIVRNGIEHVARGMCGGDGTKRRQLDVLVGSERMPGVHAPADGAVSRRAAGRELLILSGAAILYTESRRPDTYTQSPGFKYCIALKFTLRVTTSFQNLLLSN